MEFSNFKFEILGAISNGKVTGEIIPVSGPRGREHMFNKKTSTIILLLKMMDFFGWTLKTSKNISEGYKFAKLKTTSDILLNLARAVH